MNDSTRDFFDTLAKVLLRCWIIGVVMQLMLMGAVLGLAETIHHFHAVFGLSNHEWDMITCAYSALLKLCTGVFFFIPWLAIWLVLKKTDPDASQH